MSASQDPSASQSPSPSPNPSPRRRGRGRPPLSERRNIVIYLRLTAREVAELDLAREVGESRREVILRAIRAM